MHELTTVTAERDDTERDGMEGGHKALRRLVDHYICETDEGKRSIAKTVFTRIGMADMRSLQRSAVRKDFMGSWRGAVTCTDPISPKAVSSLTCSVSSWRLASQFCQRLLGPIGEGRQSVVSMGGLD